ncbi:hypothetical protein RvY_09251 [Ramazzottius varieornatus]|uniref:Uncharacterized protein n=1 Tax=Ramazzottius varieornatus TaxID=947166 RepID=A0A1D1V8M8_RAMVA|nr:hypothetical protein RvY_09251 [Ramazzottius varieornatus]
MAVSLRLRSGSSSEPSSIARHRATASRKKVDGIFASHISSTDYPRTTVDTVFPLTSKIHKTLSQSGSITKRDIVGVIHLGATYSCCGYGWTDSRGSLVYHVLDNWMGCQNCPKEDPRRTLSDMLLAKPSGDLLAIGYKAHKDHLSCSSGQRKKLLYLENFPALLSSNDQLAQPITNGTCAVGVNGAGLFRSVLDKLRSLVLDDLTQRLIITSAADVRDVKWYVTVADIEVRNNMESMVLPVCRNYMNVSTVYKRDVIATFLAPLENRPRRPATWSANQRASQRNVGTSGFLLLDIGTYHTEVSYFTICGNVVCPAYSRKIPVGGQTISTALYKIMEDIFGSKVLSTYKAENYEGFVEILNCLEKAKRNAELNQKLACHLPFSFEAHFKRKFGKHLAEKVKQKGHYYDSVNNCVMLDTQLVRHIFKPFIDKLVDLITEVLREENLLHGGLVTVYAVGGTADNPYVRGLLEQSLPFLRMKRHSDQAILPVVGTLKQALSGTSTVKNLETFRTLQSAYTIGVTAVGHCDFMKSLSVKNLSVIKNAFIPIIQKDEYLTGSPDQAYTHHFCAATFSQNSILIRVFFSDVEQKGSVSVDTMECLSQLHLHIPEEKRGETTGERFFFRVSLTFMRDPNGVGIQAKDTNGVLYGSCRIFKNVYK